MPISKEELACTMCGRLDCKYTVYTCAYTEMLTSAARVLLLIEKERQEAVKLLRKAHDEMDLINNETVNDKAYCLFCSTNQYSASGIEHTDDCILHQIRKYLESLKETK